ncbi:hypothetical protein MLD38_007992 [Melastoma candidum]|uniref:Uncharacterized protein n=1 Tax=Melastoma candidum TaxID=119954 RepID=A0ACB9RU49_9MYRT|nr:hypothetical protein MLD38_007992 [Melastoma candidum]
MDPPVNINKVSSDENITQVLIRSIEVQCETHPSWDATYDVQEFLLFLQVYCYNITLNCIEAHHIVLGLDGPNKINKTGMFHNVKRIVVQDDHLCYLMAAALLIKRDVRWCRSQSISPFGTIS